LRDCSADGAGGTREDLRGRTPAGTYTLTDGPLQVLHPFLGTEEHTTTLVGAGGYASGVVITADGKSRVFTDGNGGTSGAVELKRVEITGGDGTGANSSV
jgi:hypothetical protein